MGYTIKLVRRNTGIRLRKTTKSDLESMSCSNLKKEFGKATKRLSKAKKLKPSPRKDALVKHFGLEKGKFKTYLGRRCKPRRRK